MHSSVVLTFATIAFGCAACLIAAAIDVRERRVPNWLTACTLVAALVIAALRGWAVFEMSVAVVVCAAFLGALLHASGLLGGGDVKLLIGMAALVGFPNCLLLLLYTALAGGVLAVIVSLAQGRLREIGGRAIGSIGFMIAAKRLTLHDASAERRAAPARDRLPYALAIAGGFGALVLSQTVFPALRIPL